MTITAKGEVCTNFWLAQKKNSNFVFGDVLMSAQVHSQICPYLITHAKLVPAWKLASVGIIGLDKKINSLSLSISFPVSHV